MWISAIGMCKNWMFYMYQILTTDEAISTHTLLILLYFHTEINIESNIANAGE
jgi:hypothetical protein